MLQCHPKCMMALQLNCKPKNYILFFFTFCFLSLSLLSLHLLSLSRRAPPSSLFLSSHVSLSCSKLALELGWIFGHSVDFGFQIGGDRRLWWVVFGSVSCVGRGSGGGFRQVDQCIVGHVVAQVWIGGDWWVSRWRLGVSRWHGFFQVGTDSLMCFYFFLFYFIFYFMWFWFYGLVGGVRICGGGNVLVGGMVAIFFLSFVVAGAKGRGRKRGKGKESEIVKKKNIYIYIYI